MRKSLARLIPTTAAVLLAACGGGSGTSTATRRSASVARVERGQVVSALHGGFRTIVPSGYRNGLATDAGGATGFEYRAIGPRVGDFSTNLIVYRGAAGSSDIKVVASRALHRLSRRPAFLPKVRLTSSLHAVTVDGEPAFAVDYQVAGGKTTYHRQVFVIHGGWAYQISDVATPAQYTASLDTLDGVIRSWRWQ